MLADDFFPEPKVDDIWEYKDEIRRPLQLNEDQDKKNLPFVVLFHSGETFF